MERNIKGIWIPIEIWEAEDLSWNEKILLMEIDSFTSKNMDCYFSNGWIADVLGCTPRMASTYVSNLINRGYITQVKFDGRMRYLKSNITYFQAEWKETSMQNGTPLPHNNTIEQINKSICNNRATAFTIPTLEEVSEYCRERGNKVDPQTFIDHYTSNGWMVGKAKMKDWKASIRTWEKRETPARRTTSSKKESAYEQHLRIADELYGTSMHDAVYGKGGSR